MFNVDLIYTLLAIVVPLVELLGILAAEHAVMNAQTSQGAMAWTISLLTFPWLAFILYAILGRNKFNVYVLLRHSKDQANHHFIDKFQKKGRCQRSDSAGPVGIRKIPYQAGIVAGGPSYSIDTLNISQDWSCPVLVIKR